MKVYLQAMILGLTTMGAGCATILTGSTQDVLIESTPQGAVICFEDPRSPVGLTAVADRQNRKLRTPAIFGCSRECEKLVLLKNGYYPEEVPLGRGFNLAFLGNLVFGWIIGMLIDASTGAIFQLHNDVVKVTLRPVARSVPVGAPTAP